MSRGEGRGASAASVRGRLRELGRQRGVEFQLLLSEFAIERFLYRLGTSRHADGFVVKGATLFKLWGTGDQRATWDLDLLGRGAPTVDEVVRAVQDICDMAAEDAIEFDKASMRGEEIRSPDEYGGVRVRLVARLAGAEIPVQLDVGFGDAVEPPPRIGPYPTLLDHPEPRVLVYPREAVVAEKAEAIVSLGVTTSRMKDFYDVHRLAASFEFNGPSLVRAVRATFRRRRTPFPADEPVALTREFLGARDRERQWRAFLLGATVDVRALWELTRLSNGAAPCAPRPLSHKRGEDIDGRVTTGKVTVRSVDVVTPPEYRDIDIRRVRERLGLSQAVFASLIGASVSTVRAWERGARRPSDMARRLIELAEREPGVFEEDLVLSGEEESA